MVVEVEEEEEEMVEVLGDLILEEEEVEEGQVETDTWEKYQAFSA